MNAEQKKLYFAETALALNREGFRTETILGGTLGENDPLPPWPSLISKPARAYSTCP